MQRNRRKRCRLSWRSVKRVLGWIPFKRAAVKVVDDSIVFMGRRFRFWKSRKIQGKLKCGSFSQDARGRWYVNCSCEVPVVEHPSQQDAVGIDLGLKKQVICSDGEQFHRPNLTRTYEVRLASAQRARKKRRVTSLHAKIANARRDWAHKTSTAIVRRYRHIFIGDVSSTKLAKGGFAKSTYDAAWGMLRVMLAYKAIALGRDFRVVSEKFSTVTCSVCGSRSGPSGLRGLEVRSWECVQCGSRHHRDVNAACNILNTGLGHQTPKGISG